MRAQAWKKILWIFLSSRVLIVFSAWFGNQYIDPVRLDFRDAFCRMDCTWYMDIISHGYQLAPSGLRDGGAANWAFFPLFPKIVSFISYLSMVPALYVGYLLNSVLFFFGLYFLFVYVKKAYDEKIAMTSVLLMAFSPYSLYFSTFYSESMFFLLFILVFVFADQGKWVEAGLFAALLSATRPLGVMIVFPMLIMGLKQVGLKNLIFFKTEDVYKVWFALVIAPLGLFAYIHFLYLHTGDAMAFSHIQIAWHRYVQNPFRLLIGGLMQPIASYGFYTTIATVGGLLITLMLFLKKRYAEFSFMVLAIFIPLSTSLVAMPRYIFTLFPTYMLLALFVDRSTYLKNIMVFILMIGLLFLSVSWVMGEWYTR